MNRRLSVLVALALALFYSSSRPAAVAARAVTGPREARPLQTASQAAVATANPFLTASPLPFQAPPFDRIKDADYQPAIEEGMKRQRAEIDAIANDPAAPTFGNTLEAMERSGALLTRVSKVFFNLTQSNTNDTLQKVESDEAPRLAAHQDAIFMDPRLFARVKTLYDTRASLGLGPEAAFLVERYYRNFVRAGTRLSDGDKATLRALNEEEAKLTTDFRQRVLADTDASAVVVDDKSQLAGLTEQDLAAAAEAARDRKLEGKWLLRLDPENDDPPPAAPSLTPSGLSPSGPRTQGGCRLPTDPSDVPVGVDRPIDTGTPRPDVPMAAYVEYSGEAGGDPRTVALNVVSDGIARIVAIEGPVVAKRAYEIYLRGCGIKRMGHELKRTMNKALAHAIRAGGVVAEDETGKGGVFFSVVRLKGSVPIRLRTRGPRALDEIPPSEIQILARYLGRWQGTTPGSDENLRALLECYELKRLTTQVATSVRDSLARALPYVDEFFSGLSES
jgi:GNAT superfamily N-acetyltransferase